MNTNNKNSKLVNEFRGSSKNGYFINRQNISWCRLLHREVGVTCHNL